MDVEGGGHSREEGEWVTAGQQGFGKRKGDLVRRSKGPFNG